MIAKRLKVNAYLERFANSYFWRTKDKAEIDYIEERNGKLFAYEIKWRSSKVWFPDSSLESCLTNETSLTNRENFEEFALK